MPVLHVQFRAEAQARDGAKQQVAPALVLQLRGPVVQVALTLPQVIAQELLKSGARLPAPIVGQALIDTGASMSCIDSEAAARLGLPTVDVVKMASASHVDVDAPVHPVAFDFVGFGGLQFTAMRAMGAPLAAQGLVGLIGRDALGVATLFYNGLAGEITLCL